MSDCHDVSVVVPVYNGARSLPELVERLLALPSRESGMRVSEIVLVDDASSDDSWAVIENLAAASGVVTGVALARNYGQHAALLAGIERTTGDVIVTMDDDLQHLPEEVPKIVNALGPAVDVAYGRSIAEEHSAYRNVTSRAAKGFVSAAAGSDVARLSSGFRAFWGWLRAGILHHRSPHVSIDVALSWVTQRMVGVPVVMQERRYGTSNYTFGRLVRYALTMLLGFSTLPLRLVSYAGLILGTLGAMVFLYVIISYAVGASDVPGFAFLASAITLFSGAQLVALGLIGEYLARMYIGSVGRPAFVVREQTPRI